MNNEYAKRWWAHAFIPHAALGVHTQYSAAGRPGLREDPTPAVRCAATGPPGSTAKMMGWVSVVISELIEVPGTWRKQL